MNVQGLSFPTTFKAKWPKSLNPSLLSTSQKIINFFWNALSLIIFPIGLMRLANTLIKHFAWSRILPGLSMNVEERGDALLKIYKGQRIQLTAPDGATLEGAFFPGKKHPKKAVIYASGNAAQWEVIQENLDILKPLGVSIISINPRGVGKSSGWRYEQGYALDIYTTYEYLIHQLQMDPEDIVLMGFSMGGGYGTCGAALIQEKYPDKKISAININSFGNLSTAIDVFLSNTNSFISPLLRLSNKLLGLDIKAKIAWDSLKGKKCLFHCTSDNIIFPKASLYQAIKNHPKSKTTAIKMHEHFHASSISHNRTFFADENKKLYTELLKMLHLKKEDTLFKKIELSKDLKSIPFVLTTGSPYLTKCVLDNQIQLLHLSMKFPSSLDGSCLVVEKIYPKSET